jgi:group I intron endonuclease
MDNGPERKPRNYQNGKIYCIRDHIDGQIYVGSTCQSLSKRMAYHTQDAKKANRQNTLIYPLMLNYGLEQFYIELVEEYPCENSNQLEKREGEITREMKASLNMKVSGRTMEEYKVEEADKIRQSKSIRGKRYRENNPEKVKERRKLNYWKDPEKYKEQARKYNEEHKEEISRKIRERYLRKNKTP